MTQDISGKITSTNHKGRKMIVTIETPCTPSINATLFILQDIGDNGVMLCEGPGVQMPDSANQTDLENPDDLPADEGNPESKGLIYWGNDKDDKKAWCLEVPGEDGADMCVLDAGTIDEAVTEAAAMLGCEESEIRTESDEEKANPAETPADPEVRYTVNRWEGGDKSGWIAQTMDGQHETLGKGNVEEVDLDAATEADAITEAAEYFSVEESVIKVLEGTVKVS